MFSYAGKAGAETLALKETLRVETTAHETTRRESAITLEASQMQMQTQLKEAQDRIFEARYNERKALDIVRPTVLSPLPVTSVTVLLAANAPAETASASPVVAVGEDTPPTVGSAYSTRFTEQLPVLDRFGGDR